jgi:hypothetical protein
MTMKLPIRRTAFRATTALVLGAVLSGGAVLTYGVVAPTVASAATRPAPWEPVGNPPEAGGLLFYNAEGQQITSGKLTVAAYVEGTSTLRAGDSIAYLAAYTPRPGFPPGTWAGEGISLSTAYPNTEAPAPLNTSTLPLVTDATGTETLASYITDFPNTATTAAYKDIYVLRLITNAPSKPATTSYDSADIRVTTTAGTWSLVYPTTTTSVTTTPASPQPYGTAVTANAAVSPSTAAGTVQFEVDTKKVGTPVTVTGGKASAALSTLALGTHTVTAVFAPATTTAFTGSTGSTPFTVDKAATSTTLTATPAGSAPYGTAVTLQATVSPAAAGTVQFEDGSAALGAPVPVSGGKALYTTTSPLALGAHTLRAVFTPTTTTNDSGSTGTTSFTVDKVSTTTTLTTTPADSAASGVPVKLTASVTPTTVGGTVQFEDGMTPIGSPVTVAGGSASTTTSSLSVGHHTLHAVFTPTTTTNVSGSTGSATFAVTVVATTTTLTTTPTGPVVYGTPVTLKASVSPSAASGTVQFSVGSTDIGEPVTVTDGLASTTTSTLPVGDDTLTAAFTPTASSAYGGSTGAATITVSPTTPTTTTLTATPSSPQPFGTSVTLKATVSPDAATGSVQFEDGSTDIGGPVDVVGGGVASTGTSTLPVGTHTLKAVFTPTAGNGYGGSSGTAPFTVTKAATSTVLTTTPASPVVYGTAVTLKASVSPTTVAGTVQFRYGSTDVGSPVTVTGGKASTGTSALPAGDDEIHAVFTPTTSASYEGSTGTAPFTVTKANTTTSLATTPTSPQFAGTSVTLEASVVPSAAAGTVQFEDGSTPIGTPVTVTGGRASTGTSALTVGTHTLKAVFTPATTGNYAGSTGTAPFTVEPLVTTTTTLTATPSSPQFVGTAVTLEASVSPSSAPGTVQFEDGPTPIGAPVTVSHGQASTSTSSLAAGTHTLQAVFTPSAGGGYAGSTGTAPFIVEPLVPTSTSLAATPASPQAYGTSVTLQATVNPSTAPGTVQFSVGGTAIGGPVSVSAGVASVTTSTLPPGTHQLSAAFTPSAGSGYASSTATAPFTVTGHSGNGYWEVASDGGIFAFGDAQFYGSMGGKPLNAPIVGIAATPDGNGYWEVASDGGIFAFGDAGFYGSMGGKPLNAPIVGIAATPDGKGYWEVASDGGIFAFGDATFDGSMGGKPLNAPIVGIAATPDGKGYWEVASDGGIFAFGDAGFDGSMGGQPLNKPIVGIAATPDGDGYWEVASDGGIFAFGDAQFYGSMGGKPLNAPIAGIAATPDGNGYWEVASDGGIFAYGDAQFYGSTGGTSLNEPVVGLAAG